MYIYSATMQAKPGRGGELASMLPKLRDTVADTIGNPGYAWAVSSGAPIGAFALSTRVEGNQQLLEFQQKLGASDSYQKMAVKFADVLAAPSDTYLNQVVGAAGEQGEPAPIVVVTQSTIAGGHLSDAVNWGVEILDYTHSVTGLSGVFTTAVAGSFFDVTWIAGAESGEELDAANARLMKDTGYMSMIDKAGGFFVPGAAQRVTMVQMP